MMALREPGALISLIPGHRGSRLRLDRQDSLFRCYVCSDESFSRLLGSLCMVSLETFCHVGGEAR
jgi:hypothetical protein